ncbi:MAG: mevalonate kinase [Deltaproteobacteria bacterium]|nr:MAG: mevalonate kinase [Deltaproteobacteria bacterium]
MLGTERGEGMQRSESAFRVSAPGSLMLLGEHAVLHGRRALVCAVEQRLTLTLSPRTDRNFTVRSALGALEGTLDAPPSERRSLRFVQRSLAPYLPSLTTGFDIRIDADFSDQIGFGSSAAVTLCVHAAMQRILGRQIDRKGLFEAAYETVLALQGIASGADLAASLWGGAGVYRIGRGIEPLWSDFPLCAVYSGVKSSTPEVVGIVETHRGRHPRLFERIFDSMDESVGIAARALCRHALAEVGAILDINHGLLSALGVSTERLDTIVHTLRRDPGIFGAKISGAGLGDCVVGLGRVEGVCALPTISITPAREGLRLDETGSR